MTNCQFIISGHQTSTQSLGERWKMSFWIIGTQQFQLQRWEKLRFMFLERHLLWTSWNSKEDFLLKPTREYHLFWGSNMRKMQQKWSKPWTEEMKWANFSNFSWPTNGSMKLEASKGCQNYWHKMRGKLSLLQSKILSRKNTSNWITMASKNTSSKSMLNIPSSPTKIFSSLTTKMTTSVISSGSSILKCPSDLSAKSKQKYCHQAESSKQSIMK